MFTIGNIITLALVVCFLIAYRMTDKNYRSLDKIKKFADKCRDDLAVFVEEKSMAVKNFGIDLEIERKAAAQLMKKLTDEEIARKSEALARIDGHIKAFEASLEELFGMTDRVQENLSRIRDESAFVENTNKRVTETKEKFEQIEKALEAAARNLKDTEEYLGKKNAERLEQTAEEVLASAKSYLSDFEATAQVIERKVEEHRGAITKAERERETVLNQDMEQIKKFAKDILESAGKRADKLEDAALVKLREAAHGRVNQIKTFFEEKIKTTQDTLKAEQGTINDKIKTVHDKCSAEISDISTKYKNTYHQWVKESTELDTMAKKQREDITSSLAEFKKTAEKQHKDLETTIINTKNELNKSIVDLCSSSQTAVKQQQDELALTISYLKENTETAVKSQQTELSSTLKKIKENTETAANSQQAELGSTLQKIKQDSQTAVLEQKNEIDFMLKELKEKSNTAYTNQLDDLNNALGKQTEEWKSICANTEQNIISANDKRIDEYSKSHDEAVRQLVSLADDAAALETELRKSMQEVIVRVKNDFSSFEKEAGMSMDTAAAEFDTRAKKLHEELDSTNKELDEIRQQAHDNVSEKLAVFETNFTAELGKRASEIGRQIADWQGGILERFTNSEEKISQDWQNAAQRINMEQRNTISAMSDQLTSDLDRLKQETSAFEIGIREEMRSVDEARVSFTEQLKHNLSEMRTSSENEVKTQVGQHQISMQEVLLQKQRELEKELEVISTHCSNEYSVLEDTARNTRLSLDDWQTAYIARMREMDENLDKLGRNSRDMAAENDERSAQFRANLEDIRKELSVQKKIFDQTEDLNHGLERRREEINTDLNRLEQRKNEIAELENQLNHVRRLGDDVNNKMTRFLSENRRIELMEESFTRLLKTSAAVDDKLKSVSSSNDILQAEQVKIRKLEEAIKDTEEKYHRIEKKNEVLEETSEAIDRNFKALQKTEAAVKNAENTISSLSDQFEKIHTSIEELAEQNERATNAIDKITVLDESIDKIEKRIADMNVAREWVAKIETRLNEINKEAKEHVKLIKGLFESEKGKAQAGEGAPPPQVRDNIRRLYEQGWKIEEIAKAMKRSIGEIELTLEIITRR